MSKTTTPPLPGNGPSRTSYPYAFRGIDGRLEPLISPPIYTNPSFSVDSGKQPIIGTKPMNIKMPHNLSLKARSQNDLEILDSYDHSESEGSDLDLAITPLTLNQCHSAHSAHAPDIDTAAPVYRDIRRQRSHSVSAQIPGYQSKLKRRSLRRTNRILSTQVGHSSIQFRCHRLFQTGWNSSFLGSSLPGSVCAFCEMQMLKYSNIDDYLCLDKARR